MVPTQYIIGHGVSDLRMDFEDSAIPPPISLSAPELGAMPPEFENLKLSVSSTELLHERAMLRFYQTALAEEAELEKLRQKSNQERKTSVEIPKIQINSRDEEEISGLERIHSLRRRLSAGSTTSQHMLWAQRRQSLKLSSDLEDIVENKLQKSPFLLKNRRELMMSRQRSASEEKEEEEFAKVRARMSVQKQSSTERRSIEVVEEEKWDVASISAEDSEESLSEEESESSEDERLNYNVTPKLHFEEEEETYHPGMMTRSKQLEPSSPKSDAPFEILTKPNPLPDPNFVPKPILKKKEYEDVNRTSNSTVRKNSKKRGRSPAVTTVSSTQRQRSQSLAERDLPSTSPLESSDLDKRGSLPSVPNKVINTAAEITAFAAAGVVIPQPLLNRRKSDEEAKVVADHYGDILKSYGQRKGSVPRTYTDRESLKQAAEIQEKQETATPVEAELPEKVNSGWEMENNQSKIETLQKYASPRQTAETTVSKQKLLREKSPSPYSDRKSRRSTSQSPRRFSKTKASSRTPSKSPVRTENWSNLKSNKKYTRSGSPSPLSRSTSTPSRKKSLSPRRSPSPLPRARPKMREITTQTSVALEHFSSDSLSRTSTPTDRKQEELAAEAEVKVRGVVDYVTDLTMFFLACWLYLFKNELLAIPVLLVMVYRQLKDEMKRRMPKWILRKYKKTKKRPM